VRLSVKIFSHKDHDLQKIVIGVSSKKGLHVFFGFGEKKSNVGRHFCSDF